MFLQLKDTGDLVKILDLQELIDPNSNLVHARDQEGQEEQDTESFRKDDLVFPSGEKLPRCWLDANYRKTGKN
ncbi:MAG TPA: acetyltransferase [Nostocaceae cyanobacterium]|nr:acetyltransferase [Nostocaceae cyanobacterium]